MASKRRNMFHKNKTQETTEEALVIILCRNWGTVRRTVVIEARVMELGTPKAAHGTLVMNGKRPWWWGSAVGHVTVILGATGGGRDGSVLVVRVYTCIEQAPPHGPGSGSLPLLPMRTRETNAQMCAGLYGILSVGVVESPKSAWSTPVGMSRKKDGSYPFCVTIARSFRSPVGTPIQRLQTWCNIPVSSEGKRLSMYPDLPHYFSPLLNKLNQNDGQESENFLKEEFEIDDNYEKITVPDFSGARHSRFLHNFKTNYTIIVDVDGKRCFVMPLNRTLVLPPKNLYDLVSKMREGYYDIDTSILRETMRVVLPMIEDRSKLGDFIQRDCGSYPIYRLEKIVSGVYKRSADEPEEYKFMVFSGKNTQDIRIVNPSAFEKDESQRPIAMA
ncbi:hypothetical protein AAG570_002000 [Ranatra chinensis]|uniref:BRICHOS domain-containing protein n=1 Tax=Ranatra chinensis TaxID=642074 RepID=A0ABD0YA60_9HEMI